MNYRQEKDKPHRWSSYTTGGDASSRGEDYPFLDRDERDFPRGDGQPPYEEAGASYADFLPTWSPLDADERPPGRPFSRYPYSVDGDSGGCGGSNAPAT